MSLKAFHIFFILMAILMSLGFAAWVFMMAPASAGSSGLSVMGGLSAVIGFALVPYGVFFVRKSRKIIV